MIVVWRDSLGTSYASVDKNKIQFLDGFAYFGDGNREYKIPVDWLVEIK